MSNLYKWVKMSFEEYEAYKRGTEKVFSLVEGIEYDELLECWDISLSCGHSIYQQFDTVPCYCPVCGNEVLYK